MEDNAEERKMEKGGGLGVGCRRLVRPLYDQATPVSSAHRLGL